MFTFILFIATMLTFLQSTIPGFTYNQGKTTSNHVKIYNKGCKWKAATY